MQRERPAGLSLATLVVEARADLITYPGVLTSTAHAKGHAHACSSLVPVTIGCSGSCRRYTAAPDSTSFAESAGSSLRLSQQKAPSHPPTGAGLCPREDQCYIRGGTPTGTSPANEAVGAILCFLPV